MNVVNRIISLLLTAIMIFVVLSILGFVFYAGLFIFLGIVLYLMIATIKEELFKRRARKMIDTPKVIDMGEVEIILPQKDKK